MSKPSEAAQLLGERWRLHAARTAFGSGRAKSSWDQVGEIVNKVYGKRAPLERHGITQTYSA